MNDTPPSDSTEHACFDEAFRQGWPVIARYLIGVLGDGHDTEGAAAETFRIAWDKRARMPRPPETIPWLIAIARNVARNELRAQRRRQRLQLRLRSRGRATNTPHEARDGNAPVIAALRMLGLHDREVLVLHAWYELDGHELAAALGCSHAAAMQRLHRARTRLVAALAAPTPPHSTTVPTPAASIVPGGLR